ncbi:MAG: hypothetical protein ACLGIR_11220 [Actinomycetes bacterium]
MLRATLRAGGQPRDLGSRRARREPPAWRDARDGAAPRLGPREHIGADVTRVGIFADVDPLVTPRWWSPARFVALVGWAGLTGGALWRARREHRRARPDAR